VESPGSTAEGVRLVTLTGPGGSGEEPARGEAAGRAQAGLADGCCGSSARLGVVRRAGQYASVAAVKPTARPWAVATEFRLQPRPSARLPRSASAGRLAAGHRAGRRPGPAADAQGVLARLGDRMGVPDGAAGDCRAASGPEEHPGWSFTLLSPGEQALFARSVYSPALACPRRGALRRAGLALGQAGPRPNR